MVKCNVNQLWITIINFPNNLSKFIFVVRSCFTNIKTNGTENGFRKRISIDLYGTNEMFDRMWILRRFRFQRRLALGTDPNNGNYSTASGKSPKCRDCRRNLREMIINRDRIDTKSLSMFDQGKKKIFSACKASLSGISFDNSWRQNHAVLRNGLSMIKKKRFLYCIIKNVFSYMSAELYLKGIFYS